MAITLKDIATQAGVSQAAVSIALGSTGRISDVTRARILGIARDLGYRPNLLVQGIQTGRTQTIGLLMHFASGFEAHLFEGIHDALSARNHVPIVLCRNDRGNELEQIHSLLDRRVDGVLIRPVTDAVWEDHLGEIQQRGVPIVSLDTEVQAKVPHIDFVGTDDRHGAEVVAQHLLDLGHRRFGVASRGVFPDPMFVRAKAFADAVGSAVDTTCEVRTAGWHDHRYEDNAARALLGLTPRPTAVFATSDDLAGTVNQVAADRGLSIPHDLSLVGFSDTVSWRGARPVLTTVRQNPFEIGRSATNLLLDRVDEKHDGSSERAARKSVLHKPELIVRETTGPPPSD